MAKHTANEVAEAFISLCNEYGDYISNQKVNRLLYFAQGWHIAFYGEPMFDDRIEAWIHGPTVPAVFERFRRFMPKPLVLDPPRAFDDFPADLKAHVEDVWKAYGSVSAYELEHISKSETPWRNARNGLAADEPSTAALSLADVKGLFEEKKKRDEQDRQAEAGAGKRSA